MPKPCEFSDVRHIVTENLSIWSEKRMTVLCHIKLSEFHLIYLKFLVVIFYEKKGTIQQPVIIRTSTAHHCNLKIHTVFMLEPY